MRDTDLLGRMGGDEFAVLLPIEGRVNAASEVASRLLASLQKPFHVDEMLLEVGASIGGAMFQGGEQTARELLNEADMAMYQAKLDGGDCVRFFDQALRERSERAYRLLTRLRAAIEEERFELHYQFQFDMQTFQPCAIEALLRWRDDAGRLVMPDEFLPIALNHGLMPVIDRWVLQRACRDHAELIRSGLLDAPVAVNVSVPTVSIPGYADRVRQVLAESGLSAQHLELELTEETAMSNLEQVTQNAEQLIQMGICLAIDDFGVGFSSLSRLRILSFHKLKIDRSFIAGALENKRDESIVKAILGLAGALGMQTVAEGVECAEQVELLRLLGCTQGQGYWFARPMPLNEVRAWLEARPEPDLSGLEEKAKQSLP